MAGGNLGPSAISHIIHRHAAKKLNNISVQLEPFCRAPQWCYQVLHSRYGGVNTGDEKESLEGWEGSLRHICIAHGITALWHLPRLPPLSISKLLLWSGVPGI